MKNDNGKILIQVKRNTIREATQTAEMMMTSGTLYKDHPLINLINEILDQAVKTTQIAIERKH